MACALQTGRRLEARDERQVAAAEGAGQVASIEPREVHLQLVPRTAERGDRDEVLAGQHRQLVDQRRQLGDGQRLDAAFGIGDRGPVARLEVLAPHPLDDRIGVANGRWNDPGEVARVADGRQQHAGQAAQAARRPR